MQEKKRIVGVKKHFNTAKKREGDKKGGRASLGKNKKTMIHHPLIFDSVYSGLFGSH
jgi:hypothetical protein